MSLRSVAHPAMARFVLGTCLTLLLALQSIAPVFASESSQQNNERYWIVLGSFENETNAVRWARHLQPQLLLPLSTVPDDAQSKPLYRVLAGPFNEETQARLQRKRVRENHLQNAWLWIEPVSSIPTVTEQPKTETFKTEKTAIVPRSTPVAVSTGVPEGFEHLLEPQTSYIDVYYADTLLLSTPATFTPNTIEFSAPEKIVLAIANLEAKQQAQKALEGELALIPVCDAPCANPPQPPTVAVSLDVDRFRADLYIHRELLSTAKPVQPRFLPAASSGISALQNVSATVSGASAQSTSYQAASTTTLGFKENRLTMVSTLTNEDSFSIDELSARRDRNGVAYAAGLFSSAGENQRFSGTQDIAGIHVSTSLRTRADLALAGGAPINLFLPRRAQVDLLRDGRLVTSAFYDAGNQQIDTSALPEGVYDVQIRIRDDSGERSEIRTFSKSNRLPPADQPLVYAEMGRVVDRNTRSALPEDTGEWIARTGFGRRLNDDTALQAGMALSSETTQVEAGLFRIGSHYEVASNAFVGKSGDKGVQLTARLALNNLSLTTDYRRVISEHSLPENTAANDETNPDTPRAQNSRPALEQVDSSTGSVSAYYPIGPVRVSASLRSQRRGNGARTHNQAVAVQWPMRTSPHSSIEFSMDVAREDDRLIALAGLRYQVSRGNWTTEVSPRGRYSRDSSGQNIGHDAIASASWNSDNLDAGDLRTRLLASSNPEQQLFATDTEFQHRRGEARLAFSRSSNNGAVNNAYSGGFSTSVLANSDAVTVGGAQQAQAAVMIHIPGHAPGSSFDVLVNDVAVGKAPAGATTAIHLRPFDTYRIRLKPRGEDLVSFEDHMEQVTLYPGNVVHLSWAAHKVVIAFGRITDALGAPIAHAVIENVEGFATTDENGLFQAEIADRPLPWHLNIDSPTQRCIATVTELERRSAIGIVGDVVCTPVTVLTTAQR